MKTLTKAQELLRTHLLELGISTEPEVQFHSERKFRFDLASMELRIGFEVDGGMWNGGHRHGKAIENDYEKDRLAQLYSWRVFRFTNRQVLSGEALAWLRENLQV